MHRNNIEVPQQPGSDRMPPAATRQRTHGAHQDGVAHFARLCAGSFIRVDETNIAQLPHEFDRCLCAELVWLRQIQIVD